MARVLIVAHLREPQPPTTDATRASVPVVGVVVGELPTLLSARLPGLTLNPAGRWRLDDSKI